VDDAARSKLAPKGAEHKVNFHCQQSGIKISRLEKVG